MFRPHRPSVSPLSALGLVVLRQELPREPIQLRHQRPRDVARTRANLRAHARDGCWGVRPRALEEVVPGRSGPNQAAL